MISAIFLAELPNSGWSSDELNLAHSCFRSSDPAVAQRTCPEGKHNLSSQLTEVQNGLLPRNAEELGRLERDFFHNFANDQFDQTKCEMDMLKATAMLPDEGHCIDPRTNKERLKSRNTALTTFHGTFEEAGRNLARGATLRISKEAEKIQRVIAGRLWKALPKLSELRKDCKIAEDLRRTVPKERCSSYRGDRVCAPPDPALVQTHEAKYNEKSGACASLNRLIPTIWGQPSADMNAYIDKMTDVYERGLSDFRSKIPPLSRAPDGEQRFMELAVPVENGRLIRDGDVDWRMALEGVIGQTFCASVDRYNVFQTQLAKVGAREGKYQHWGLTAEGFTGRTSYHLRSEKHKDDSNFRKFLMRDGGVAAMNYLDRNANYAALKESLSCHLRNYYYDRERDEARLRTYVSGAAVVVASVATGGTALILSGALLAASAYNVKNVCGDITNGAHTLQAEPVCEIFRENKDQLDTVQVMQKHLDNESCKMAQIEAAMDAGGVATSAIKIAKLGRGAQQVSNGLNSIGDLNKLNRAAERLVGKDADNLLMRLSSSNPEQQKKNYEILEALSKHDDLSRELGRLNTDGLTAVISKLDSPETIENLSALQKLDPTEFSRQAQELVKACAHAAGFWSLVIPTAEAAFCNVAEINRIVQRLSVVGRQLPTETRTLLQQGYKPRQNVTIKRLENEGYVGLDVLEMRGRPTKILARDAEGRTHLLDLKPGDRIESAQGFTSVVSGANEATKRRVLTQVAKNPNSVSEANWKALRKSAQTDLRRSARHEAERLGASNKLQSTGLSKGYLEVDYADGTTKRYRYSSQPNVNTYWSEINPNGTSRNWAPDFDLAERVNYVDESAGLGKRTQLLDAEQGLPTGLKRNDRQLAAQAPSSPAPSRAAPPAPPKTWVTPGSRSFSQGVTYQIEAQGRKQEGRFLEFFQGDRSKPVFQVGGQRLIGTKVLD